jgi:hypothetical protein
LCSDGFSVVLSWLGGFFCGGFFCGGFFCRGFAVFSDMIWWLGSFSDVLSWLGGFFCGAAVFFFVLLMALALPPLVFSAFFGGDSGLMSISWLELAPPGLNNGSCVDGEQGDVEGREDDLGDDDGRDCGGSVGGIDPPVWGIIM